MQPPHNAALTVAANVQSIVQRALEQTVNGVVVTDARVPHNPIVHVNSGFTRLTGYAADEVLGQNCGFLQRADRDQQGIQVLREAIAKGQEASVVVRNYRRDGTRFWNRVEMSPVRDDSGRVTHFFALQTDVTLEREREEASMMRSLKLEQAITAHPLGFMALDRSGRIQMFSQACAALLGIAEATVLGQHVQNLVHAVARQSGLEDGALVWPGDRAAISDATDAPQPDASPGARAVFWELPFPVRRVVEVSCSEAGELTGEQMVMCRDVTQARQQQMSRDHFLSTAAHELRAPLGSIRGFTELMLLRKYEPEQARSMLETVLKQSIRLGSLLDDLLDLAHLDEKGERAFTIEPVCLASVMRHAADIIELPGSLHTFTVSPPGTAVQVLANASRLEQVFINLLSNAVKYSPDGGEVRFEFDASDPEWVVVAVSDQGIGLSPEDLQRLFTRFFRANPGGSIPGTGLGLSIVREMVERMGGRVTVSSELGRGTTFFVHLRRPSVEEMAKASLAAEA